MIRPMTMEDLDSVLEINNDAILNTTALYRTEPETLEGKQRWFLEIEKENNPMFVYEEDGKVVGFANDLFLTKGTNIPWNILFMSKQNIVEKESEKNSCKN